MCDTTALPVTAPRSVAEPSPQSTDTALVPSPATLPFCGGVPFVPLTVIVKVAGRPALGGVVGGTMTIVGAEATLTMTLADAWPDADGVAGVGVVGEPGVVGAGVVVGGVVVV